MALTNAQYNSVMRGYEKQQLENAREKERRVREVYGKLPGVKALDPQISAAAAAAARALLAGDQAGSEAKKAELARLREQKRQALTNAGYPADYLELHYRCPECRDTGYVNGRRCRCFEQARIRILYDQSNVSEVLKRENFSTLSLAFYDADRRIPGLPLAERAYMEQVVCQCREFAAAFPEKGQNILFTGSTGVGKTFLGNCILKALIDRGFSVICLSSQDLFDRLSRVRFGRDAEEAGQEADGHILECDMLMLDDLGTELNNTFVSSQLFSCVSERILRKKGTIITTNLSMTELRDAYSDRVTSRITSSYRLIPLYGNDIRLRSRRA